MIKVRFISMLALSLLVGCNYIEEDIAELEELRQVHTELESINSCKLTLNTSSVDPELIEIDIVSSYNDNFLPGKIIFDCYEILQSKKVSFSELRIRNSKGEIYSLDYEFLKELAEYRRYVEKSIVKKLLTDSGEVYEKLSVDIRSNIDLEDFIHQLNSLDLRSLVFNGVILTDTLVTFNYKNSSESIEIVCGLSDDSRTILGFHI